MLHCVCQCYSLTPSLFNYCNICPGQHTTQQVSKLARTTKQREASSHVELMAPILQTPCKAWKSLSPPAHQCAPALIHPTPGRLPLLSPELLDTFISLAMLAPLKQKQEKAMNIPQHTFLPVTSKTKPFKTQESQHRDTRRKGRTKSQKFISLSRQSNLGDINAKVQQLRKVRQLAERRWESLWLADRPERSDQTLTGIMANHVKSYADNLLAKLLYQKTTVSASTSAFK